MDDAELSIGQYLDREGYGDGFKEDYLLPMTAAIWSTPADKCALDFPARTLIRFFHNHHLMQVDGRPSWLTIEGGSKRYVDAVVANLPTENLHLNTKITSVTPHEGGVRLQEESGRVHEYDYVILATHSDTTVQMLEAGGGLTDEEDEILSKFEWSKNEAVLHWDERMMPIRRRAWSAWNYLTSSEKPSAEPTTTASDINTVSLTYFMNDLQNIPEDKHGPIFVTLNPPFEVDPAKTAGRYKYDHPMYTAASVKAQLQLPSIQNKRRVTYAGAWTNHGFHEDGFTSGLKIAVEHFGANPPFPIRPANRPVKREETARKITAVLEKGRRAVHDSPVWPVLEWLIVLLFLAVEQALILVGWPKRANDVKMIRGFWQPGRPQVQADQGEE